MAARSSYLLGYADVTAAMWDASLVGLLVLVMAWYRTVRSAKGIGLSWIYAVLGAWLVVAPSTLGYSDTGAAVANDIVVGLVVLTLGAVSAVFGRRLSTARCPVVVIRRVSALPAVNGRWRGHLAPVGMAGPDHAPGVAGHDRPAV